MHLDPNLVKAVCHKVAPNLEVMVGQLLPDTSAALQRVYVYAAEADLFGVTRGPLLLTVRALDDRAVDVTAFDPRVMPLATEVASVLRAEPNLYLHDE